MTLDELLKQYDGKKFDRGNYSVDYVEWLEGKLARLLDACDSARASIRRHRYPEDPRPHIDDQSPSFRQGYDAGLEMATSMMLDAFIEATRREEMATEAEPTDRLADLEKRLEALQAETEGMQGMIDLLDSTMRRINAAIQHPET